MKKKWELTVSPSCYFRRCHPETCICSYRYVVHDFMVRFQADTKKECQDWIKKQDEEGA